MGFLQGALPRRFVAAQALQLGTHAEGFRLARAEAGVPREPLGELDRLDGLGAHPLGAQQDACNLVRGEDAECRISGKRR